MDSPSSDAATDTRCDAARCLSVRFEDACVLIPPACLSSKSTRPRLITKSYSLPLWKSSPSKKSSPQFPDPQCPDVLNTAPSAEAERKAFSLTVSVPSLSIKHRSRRPSLPPPSPCLSKRSPLPSESSSDEPPTPHSPTLSRTPTFPQILPAALGLKQLETVPLRPCCETCHHSVDAALASGERWSERWSSGAVRRYSEGEHVHLHTHGHAHHPALFAHTRHWAPKTSHPDVPLIEALTIDEVEVKRRADNYSRAMLNNGRVKCGDADADADAEGNADADADEEALENSDEEDSCTDALPRMCIPPIPRFRAAVLLEEDEDKLFPLPSPRRSPNQSPSLTPTGSQTNLPTASGSQTNLSVSSGSQTNLTVPSTGSQTNLAGPSGNRTNSATGTDGPLKSDAKPVPVSIPTPPAHAPPSPCDSFPFPRPAASPPPPSSSPPPAYRDKRTRSTSPEARRATPRRSSFSIASGTLLKGSASVLKGVAAGISGGVGTTVH